MDMVRRMSFPKKINYVLSKDYPCIEQCGVDGFRILDEEQFETTVLPRFFKTSRMTSFKRQLNMYGFARILEGPRANTFCHPDFIVGDYDRVGTIHRVKKCQGVTKHTHCGTKRPNQAVYSEEIVRQFSLRYKGRIETGFKVCESRSSTRELLEQIRFSYKERTYAELLLDHQRQKASDYRRSKCITAVDGVHRHTPDVVPPPIIASTEEVGTDYVTEMQPEVAASAWNPQVGTSNPGIGGSRSSSGEKMAISPTAFVRKTSSFTAQLDALDLGKPPERNDLLTLLPPGGEGMATNQLISGFRCRKAADCSNFYLFGAE